MLKSLGSYSGPIDGYYGASTVRGVKYYQKKHGLPATGSVDVKTLQSISYSYADLKASMKAKSKAKWNGKAKSIGKGNGAGGGAGGGQGENQGKSGGIGGGQGENQGKSG
ncbi:peptidoglycan-binding domain-containing protein, partial [Paenibacillus endophyticus]|uniref:peptidoglycan-binding domain-containing protein n=1 Tax=Paenibacillus endophyticus TaxID=1294268 RepID=UPI0039F09B93